jgi:hypothetical protein
VKKDDEILKRNMSERERKKERKEKNKKKKEETRGEAHIKTTLLSPRITTEGR